MLVARLRRKIEPDPKVPRFILTLPGEGYKFAARPAAVQPPAPASMSHQEPSNLSVSFFERRLMTIVACQISGFAALASKHDPEVLHTATDSVCRKVQEIARPLHGIMMKTPGDGLLIYFGHLEAREDDAERAVRVSLELVRAVPTIDVGLTTQLHLRIGIATGVMLVGNIDGPQHYSAVGEALNLALHLRSVAPPDGVVIAISTHELLGRFFDFEKLEPVIVDDGATTAWRVTGESAVIASRFDALRRVGMLGLVGRDEQMELLLRRWQQAKCGAGQVVMLTGEPGIGKSRLVAEVEHRMAGEAHVLQKYFGLPHQADASMSALIGQLRTDCDFNQDDSTETKINKLADILRVADSDVAKSVALISDLLLLRSEDKHGIARLSPSERKKETFTTLLRRIERSAAVAPILVIVEDVHWIDPASLEFLALLVENVLALPVLIVMTSRPGFIPPWIGGANISVLELPRLGRSDASLLLEQVVGGKSLPRDVAAQILAPTEGIPLFIEELTRSLIETGILRGSDGSFELDPGHVRTIPRTLRGSLLAQLDRLGPAKEVAQIGAVIGREFSYELISAIAVMPEEALRVALDRLSASELVYSRGTPPLATYMFKHALIRDAAYEMLLRGRRVNLHGATARALEETFPEICDAQPELLAHHYKEAENAEKAIVYLSVAGIRALSRSALNEAHTQVTQALALISRLPETDARRRDQLKLQVILARTLLEQKGYANAQVGEAYAKAADLSKSSTDNGMELAVHYGLWAHHYIGGEPKAMLRDADGFLELAKQRKDTGPIVTGHRLVGTARLINGDIEKAKAALEESLTHYDAYEHGASSAGGQDLRARFGQDVGVTVYSYLSWASWLSGFPDQALRAATAAEERGRSSGHVHSLFYALWHVGMANILLRNKPVVARLAAELTNLADDRGLPYWQALGNFLSGWHAKHSGRPSKSIALLQRGLELWQQTGSRVFRPILIAFLADAYAANEQPALARGKFDEALRISIDTGERWAQPEIHRLYGNALIRPGGDLAATASHYKEAITIARQQGSKSFELRAIISMCHLAPQRKKQFDSRHNLSNVFDTFTEGFDTADLIEAKALLKRKVVEKNN